jgi:dynein heavy chain 1
MCVEAIKPQFDDSEQPSFMTVAIESAEKATHVMDFTAIRCLEAMFALVRKGISNVIEYNENHSDFPLEREQISNYMRKWVLFSAIWGIGGSMNLATRTEFGEELRNMAEVEVPSEADVPLLDFECRVDD